ncbi:MAG TPA: LptF/LptG family permease [Rectinemataceae bacterium]|nr:LptF/LptG family permease [Rectinemataceae bacterium]
MMVAGRRLRPGIVEAYVGREYLLSFAVSFAFFFVVFFVNQLLLMAEDILSKRAPLRDVLLLLVFATPSVIAMSVPFASLVGALMAAGRLAADSELLVFQASGIRTSRVFLPFVVMGAFLSVASFAVNDVFLPYGTLEFGKLYRKMLVSAPALELQPWSSRHYKDITVVTGDVSGSTVSDILIFDRTEQRQERVISARKAVIEARQESSEIVLKLSGVWTQTLKDGETGRFEYSSCDTMEYRIRLTEGNPLGGGIGPREMSSTDLGRSISSQASDWQGRYLIMLRDGERARVALAEAYNRGVATAAAWEGARAGLSPLLAGFEAKALARPERRNLDIYILEYWKKFSIPAGAMIFVVLSFPLGARSKRSGRSVGFGLGLLIAVIYWAMLIGGQTLGSRLGFSPFWSMWLPDAVVLAAGALTWLFARRQA